MSISVKIKVFEGPLDLLLHLIDKNKINIYDIPIAEVTDQYLEHMELIEKDKLETMSAFIEMAAILINLKSRMLLPEDTKEEEALDPRLDLVDRLLEYKKFKLAAQELKAYQGEAMKFGFKEATIPDEISKYIPMADPEKLLENIDFSMLYKIFQSVIKKKTDKIDPIRSKFGDIQREQLTVEDKIQAIRVLGKHTDCISFKELLEEQMSKVAVIVTFLAILELMKEGYIKIIQELLFDTILVKFVGREAYGS